jgi:hypothetical protein
MFRLLLLSLICFTASAQTKKVVFEEITGAYCGNCPSGAWIVDSLTRKYPNLIGVAIHSYGVTDAMYFSGCDSIDDLVNTQGGAPFGDLDRMKYPVNSSPLYMLFSYIDKFDSIAQVRLAAPPLLTVGITPAWTSATRNISALIDINILANFPPADYRISLYVVEDSVTGTGSSYDQENFYDTSPPGNPFFGMGNPIIGYVHRHVLRAALPTPLGAAGILPASPASGQHYSTTINYTLHASVNENKTHLVAFVYKYAPASANNEMLNAEEISLLSQSTGINSFTASENSARVFPNPSEGIFNLNLLEVETNIQYNVFDYTGRQILNGRNEKIDLSSFSNGIYFLHLHLQERTETYKLIKLL